MSRADMCLKHFRAQRNETEARVAEGIEKNRKGNVSLRVVDGEGRPVRGVRVHAKLVNHAFLHGGNLYALDEMESAEKNAIYRKKFKEVFNAATLPIYWKDLEPEEGKLRFDKDSPVIYRRPPVDRCLEYCEENGIRPKAHCLNYFQRCHYPAWCPENDIPAIKRLCEKRFSELAQRYRDRIPDWEVINETLGAYVMRDNPPIFFEKDCIEWSFELARTYFPGNRLIINEDPPSTWGDLRGDRSTYFLQIDRALSRGTTIDGIGLQCHMIYENADPKLHEKLCNPKNLFDIMDLYGQFGLPLQITETQMAAHACTPEAEALQEEMLREMYSIWFSHEAVEAIIYWDLADGYCPGAPLGAMDVGWNVYCGGLLRFDLSEKPAYKALRELFGKAWSTDVILHTDEQGCAGFRGFYGDYETAVDLNGKVEKRMVTLKKGMQEDVTIVI